MDAARAMSIFMKPIDLLEAGGGDGAGATKDGVIPNTIVVGLNTGDVDRANGPCRLALTEASNAGYQLAEEAAKVGKSRM